jgi:hypothetical protein
VSVEATDPDLVSYTLFDQSKSWSDLHRLNEVLNTAIPQLSGSNSFIANLMNDPGNKVKAALKETLPTLLTAFRKLNVTVDDPSNPEAGMRARVTDMTNMDLELAKLLTRSGTDMKKGLNDLLTSNMKAVEVAQKSLDNIQASLTQVVKSKT